MIGIIEELIAGVLEVKKAPEWLKENRLKRCSKCEYLKNDKCLLCGCFVELKAAMDFNKNPKKFLRIEKTHCMDGRWPYIDNEGKEHENDLEIRNFYLN